MKALDFDYKPLLLVPVLALLALPLVGSGSTWLTLTVAGWGEPQVRQFSDRLRGAGYAAEFAEGRVVVSHARGR